MGNSLMKVIAQVQSLLLFTSMFLASARALMTWIPERNHSTSLSGGDRRSGLRGRWMGRGHGRGHARAGRLQPQESRLRAGGWADGRGLGWRRWGGMVLFFWFSSTSSTMVKIGG